MFFFSFLCAIKGVLTFMQKKKSNFNPISFERSPVNKVVALIDVEFTYK